MSAIDDLRAKVTRLESQLHDARKSYNAVLIEEYPIKPGMIYTNKKGQRAQVHRVVMRYSGPCPIFRYFKKDGTLGNRESGYYFSGDWTKEVKP